MVWKCIHGVAPAYLNDLCIPATDTSGREKLRFASSRIFLVTRVWTAAGREVSPSMDRPSGTVCCLHYEHQSCHRTLSHVHCTYLFSNVWRRWDGLRAEYKYTDLASYLLRNVASWSYLKFCKDFVGNQVQDDLLLETIGIDVILPKVLRDTIFCLPLFSVRVCEW